MDGKHVLVTTELENTWPAGGKVLFLGEWCRLHDRRHRWQDLDAEVLDYHWNDRKKLRKDFERIQGLNRTLLLELVPALNRLHGMDCALDYWRLLLGYWLNIYTTVLFDRWALIENAVALGQPLRSFVIDTPPSRLAAHDTADFVRLATEDPSWNHALFALLLSRKSAVELIRAESMSDGEAVGADQRQAMPSGKMLMDIAKKMAGLSLYLKRADRFVVAASHLPITEAWLLEIRLGQFPGIYWHVPDTPPCMFDATRRNWKLEGAASSMAEFDMLVRELLPLFMPRVFVEGFGKLRHLVDTLPWPVSPQVIWTSNYHFAHDVFKLWAAEKHRKGTRLVWAEHGGLGTCAFNGAHSYELAVADRYLSTGWHSAEHPQVVPIGNFRQLNRRRRYKTDGRVLLVCGIMPRYAFDVRSMMLSSQVGEYFEEQFRFVGALPERLRPGLLVRLHSLDYGWRQQERWQKRHPEIALDEGQASFWKVAKTCRLLISTYNSTTYIDSFTLNVPTVLYWNPERWEVKDEALPLFAELARVGIFHETPESAAAHVAAIWNDVEEWWRRPDVQEARMLFCRQYAASPSNSIERIESILREEAAIGSRAMAGT